MNDLLNIWKECFSKCVIIILMAFQINKEYSSPPQKKKKTQQNENKKRWKFAHPQTIQGVEELVSSSEQIWRNIALHHLLAIGSSAVNGCRQNELNICT